MKRVTGLFLTILLLLALFGCMAKREGDSESMSEVTSQSETAGQTVVESYETDTTISSENQTLSQSTSQEEPVTSGNSTAVTNANTNIKDTDEMAWYDGDLDARLRLARQYLYGILNSDENNIPYFGIACDANSHVTFLKAGDTIGLPHITGRALDALFNIEASTGEVTDATIEQIYTDYFYQAMDSSLCLPVYISDDDGLPYVETHNLREACEGLAQMILHRSSSKAATYANGFVTSLTKITSLSTKAFSLTAAQANITDATDLKKINGSVDHPYPVSSGRLIGALVQLYHVNGDARALEYAGYYAESALTCFNDDGTLNISKTGQHVHSITATLSGIVYYAMETNNTEMIEKVRKIYENGFEAQDYMSSYGWIKEQLALDYETDQGEVNQVGDMIQVQLGLAQYGDTALWYQKAETFMRGMLLPSQVLKADIFKDYEQQDTDATTNTLTRVLGGWGFPTPVSHMVSSASAVNTIDITEGAVQAIVVFKKHIATYKNNTSYLNLYFNADNDVAKVTTSMPLAGSTDMLVKNSGNVAVRIPSNIVTSSFALQIDGVDQSYSVQDGYAVLGNVPAGTTIHIQFTPSFKTYQEVINGKQYTITMYGEQTTVVSPRTGLYYLHYNFPVMEG